MKRFGNLWDTLTDYSNLRRALHNAVRGKRNQGNAARFLLEQERLLCKLQDELILHTYKPGAYRSFEISDPKKRIISAAPFRDRVVHHALVQVLEPIFEPCFIHNNYANRKGKGTHRAVKQYMEYANRYRFVLKCDISKYFPSIDHIILKELIRRKIKDPSVLWLADLLIDHNGDAEQSSFCFPGDDLFTCRERPHGLPLGNQTSQFFAGLYLNGFDHWIQEELGVRAYIRYVDDFVIFGNERSELNEVRSRCRERLVGLRLLLHPDKVELHRCRDGVRFLGYRVWPTHCRLPQAYVHRLRRKIRKMQRDAASGRLTREEIERRLAGWTGHIQHAGGSGLLQQMLSGITFPR